ncbi:Na+/H+ antiporter subunit E [Bartonella sp. AR 15-3]|uniref:Na+/H+ antiporter subunit E n=1 Tax=Bartonella sp. AR 15-3 TaxID=545617 RepID=UPI0001F4BFB4|nr:Na+/H+ antiporter subunit E [Bartonella sp. AR 15-3]OPB32351.1 multisubunit potassium/proton antiporter, PhaE subunit [Bartonella sp. AR 15-3]CBI80012.1 PH adaptation potassium efflux system e [Bartonella sp. AR 15-3]
MNRFFSYPFFSCAIVLMWMILNGFNLGQFLLGIIIALLSSFMMQLIEVKTATIKNWKAVFLLLFRVFIDSISSNISVAWLILTKRCKKQKSGFVVIPLVLESQIALTILACILAVTPGTVWIAYNSNNSELLIHVLNLIDGNDYEQLIKQRYEQLLLEIFS